MPDILQLHLLASLFEEVADVFFAGKVADTFGANDVLWPKAGDEMVKLAEAHGLPTIIDKSADAVLLCFAFIVMMMVMVVFVVVLMFVVMVMMMMPVLVVVIIIIVIVVIFRFNGTLNGFNPCGAGCDLLVVKEVGVQQLVKLYVAIVAVDNLCLWLDAAYDLTNAFQLFWFHIGSLVQQDNVAELYLLDDEVLDVFLIDVLLGKV